MRRELIIAVIGCVAAVGLRVSLSGDGGVFGFQPESDAQPKRRTTPGEVSFEPLEPLVDDTRDDAFSDEALADLIAGDDIIDAVEEYREARRAFRRVAVGPDEPDEATYEAAIDRLSKTNRRVAAFARHETEATIDAFREATAAGTAEDQELWGAFVQLLIALDILPEAHEDAVRDAMENAPIISDFYRLYPRAPIGGFTYWRGDPGDVWWESLVFLYGRYALDLAVRVELSDDRRQVVDVGEPEFRLSPIPGEGEDWEFGAQTWKQIEVAEGRVEAVFDGIVTDEPLPHFRWFMEESAREEAAMKQAIAEVPVIRQFHELYPDAIATFGGYASGRGDPPALVPWRSTAHLYGRYVLTMELDVELAEDGREVVRWEDPNFHLQEHVRVERSGTGSFSLAGGPGSRDFGADKWRQIVAEDGRLEEVFPHVITDQPVERFDAYAEYERWLRGRRRGP